MGWIRQHLIKVTSLIIIFIEDVFFIFPSPSTYLFLVFGNWVCVIVVLLNLEFPSITSLTSFIMNRCVCVSLVGILWI